MEDPSNRLRRDQDNHNRRRENDRYDRGHAIESHRSEWRIGELTDRIEAEKRKRIRNEAHRAMTAAWPETRSAIEACASVTPDVQATWLKQFDATRYSGNSSVCQSLADLESEVDALAAAVSAISEDVRKTVEPRQTSPLAQALPELTSFRQSPVLRELGLNSEPPLFRLRRGLLPSQEWPDVLGTERRSENLQPIRDRIMRTVSIPLTRRVRWIARLDEIEKRDRRAGGLSAGEKLAALITDIDLLAAEIRSVAAALGSQASRCRLFWGR